MAQLNKKIIAVAVAVVFCLLAAFWPHEREADVLKIEQQAVTASEKEEARKQSRGSHCRRRRNDGRSQ